MPVEDRRDLLWENKNAVENMGSRCCLGPVRKWQGVTFSGLAAGQYPFTYIPQAFPTADWAPINTAVQTSIVTLSGAVVGAAPATIPTLSEWAMVLLSLLLAAGAVVAMRRRGR